MRPLHERYAEALFSLTQDEDTFAAAADRLADNSAIWTVLLHPGIPTAEKHGLIDRVLPGSPALLADFFKLLCDKDRIHLLPQIRQAYHELRLDGENAMDAVMRCAYLPAEGDVERLQNTLCALHGKSRVTLAVRQEPALIGGFVLQAGGITYDRSVKGALHSLQNTLKAR